MSAATGAVTGPTKVWVELPDYTIERLPYDGQFDKFAKVSLKCKTHSDCYTLFQIAKRMLGDCCLFKRDRFIGADCVDEETTKVIKIEYKSAGISPESLESICREKLLHCIYDLEDSPHILVKYNRVKQPDPFGHILVPIEIAAAEKAQDKARLAVTDKDEKKA
jgi:hypothetical protein